MNLVDSSGWLEYLANGKNADFFAAVIEDTDKLIVSIINVYEVFKRVLQQRDENSAIQAIALLHQGIVINVDNEIALMAAHISLKNNLPLADSIIYATAKKHNALLWTQDTDFTNLDNVQFVEK